MGGTVYLHLPRTNHQQVGFLVQSILTCYTHTKHQQVLLLLQSSFTYYTHKTPTGAFLGTVHFHLLHTQNTNRYFSWYSPFPLATYTKHQQVGFLVQSTFTCYTHKTPTGTSLGTVHFHLPYTNHREVLSWVQSYTHKTLKGTSVGTVRFHLPPTQNTTPRGTFLGTVHLHLQVPSFAYISSIYPVLHTFHLHTLFSIDFSEIGAPPTDKGEVFSW